MEIQRKENGKIVWTDDLLNAVCDQRKVGLSYAEIGKKYGIADNAIGNKLAELGVEKRPIPVPVVSIQSTQLIEDEEEEEEQNTTAEISFNSCSRAILKINVDLGDWRPETAVKRAKSAKKRLYTGSSNSTTKEDDWRRFYRPVKKPIGHFQREIEDSHVLRWLMHLKESRRLNIEDFMVPVSRYYRVAVNEIKGPRRYKDITRARQMLCYLAYTHTDKSLPQIGIKLGGRDHSTILHSYRKINNLAKSHDLKTIKDIKYFTGLLGLEDIFQTIPVEGES